MAWTLLIVVAGLAASRADTAADCDFDGDGHEALGCDGDDCDDADPQVYAGAQEQPGDGVDQDCDGLDDGEPVLWVESGGCAARGALGLGAMSTLLARRRRT